MRNKNKEKISLLRIKTEELMRKQNFRPSVPYFIGFIAIFKLA